jgi:hypothetical protein
LRQPQWPRRAVLGWSQGGRYGFAGKGIPLPTRMGTGCMELLLLSPRRGGAQRLQPASPRLPPRQTGAQGGCSATGTN